MPFSQGDLDPESPSKKGYFDAYFCLFIFMFMAIYEFIQYFAHLSSFTVNVDLIWWGGKHNLFYCIFVLIVQACNTVKNYHDFNGKKLWKCYSKNLLNG